MRVLVLVKATEDSEAGVLPTTELLEAMGRFNQDLVEAGILKAAAGLKPSSAGKRVAFELVAGYWLWEVKDMDEAVAWVKRCPNPMPGPSEIEIRPFYETSDLETVLTPDVAEIHERAQDGLSGA